MKPNWLDIEPKRASDTEKVYQDPLEMNNDLAMSYYSRGQYTKLDRYRDFRHIFYGSEQGKRVLYEILAWAGIYRPETPKNGEIDVNRVFEHIGRKKMGLDILSVLSTEPKPEREGVVRNKKE